MNNEDLSPASIDNIIVIGAGPVGATFALLAKRQGLNVTLLEARVGPSHETRSLALSHGSREILATANAWNANLNATEIHAIHTSQKGGFGRSLITREDGDVPALGYVLSYADLQTALDAQMEAQHIEVQRSAVVTAFAEHGDHVEISFTQAGSQQTSKAAIVVLVDGGANLGKVPAISIAEKDYGQAALLGHIETDTLHRGTAYERFTPEGPAALLPHGGNNDYSMVWVSSPARIEELKALDDAAFLEAFQQHFGHRAGSFKRISARRSYPLRLRTVSSRVAGNIAVVGNAAQALHPVAGQGFNLGLRDASDLANLLSEAQRARSREATFHGALKKYALARNTDVERSVGFTDFLVGAFSNDHLATRLPRGLALAVVDMLPFARRALARRMLFGAMK